MIGAGNLNALVLVALILGGIAILLRDPDLRNRLLTVFGTRAPAADEALPYLARVFLLSKGEAAFFHTLRRAAGDHFLVCPKVRLSDVLKCTGGTRRRGFYSKIAQKHVDFVLCDPRNIRILVAVELDDQSHRRADRQRRDAFVDRAMRAAGLPLLHVPAAGEYDVRQIADQIRHAVRETQQRPAQRAV